MRSRSMCNAFLARQSWSVIIFHPKRKVLGEDIRIFFIGIYLSDVRFGLSLLFGSRWFVRSIFIRPGFSLTPSQSSTSMMMTLTNLPKTMYITVLAAIVVFLATKEASSGSAHRMYDRHCIYNIGCGTDFQDMILGVSLLFFTRN